jgi:hypothetical protein
MMYDDITAVDQLFNYLAGIYISCFNQLKDTGIEIKNMYGFPGVYCNDLQMPYISPYMIRRFILPCYERVARACDGLIVSINCSDVVLAEEMLNLDGVIGATFHMGIPIQEIRRLLGRKLFVMNHYVYLNELDKPTLIDGIYCNPIVQSYSRELELVWQELSPYCSMLVTIERYSLDQVVKTRNNLLNLRQHLLPG